MSLPTVNPINQLLAAGPDKYSNQFSVLILRKERENYNSAKSKAGSISWDSAWLFSDNSYFLVKEAAEEDSAAAASSEDTSTEEENEEGEEESTFSIRKNNIVVNSEHSTDFKVRVVDIEIPLPKFNNFQTPFFDTQVERTVTKLTFNNKTVLNLEFDNSLIYLDAFQNLAGRFNSVENRFIYANTNKKYIYNIYVISNPLTPETSDYINSNTKALYWEFYDCKFLGNESEIKFSNSSSVITGAFPFTFFDLRLKKEY